MTIKTNTFLTIFYLLTLNHIGSADVMANNVQSPIPFIPLIMDIPVIEPAEMPDKLVLSKLEGDDDAKNKLNLADQLRKKLTNFTFSGAISEAYKLYDSVAEMSNISPDLRARAKINAAQLYPFANTEDSSYASIVQRKNETLDLFNKVIEDESFSKEIRGWAKYCLAKSYVQNWYDELPVDAKQKALDLFQNVIADIDISPETKLRVKTTLATFYSEMLFNVSPAEAKQKAESLFNEVKKDSKASEIIKAEADFGLASLKSAEEDPYNMEKLKLLKAISVETSYGSSIHAKAKAKIASGLLKGEFDTKPSEAAVMALAFYKEIIADSKTDPKASSKSDSKAGSGSKGKLEAEDLYAYKQQYALHLANNDFNQKGTEAKTAAKALYDELLIDVSIYTDQKVPVRWQLALNYLHKKIDPPTGKDAKTAAIDLINEILNDPHISLELFLIVKLNFARLHHQSFMQNPLGLSSESLKDAGLRLLDELINDSRLSGKQKEMVQTEIKLWNGVLKQ
jgi:hypothetical protein